MDRHFWIQQLITQVCSASCSLIASIAIAAFTAFGKQEPSTSLSPDGHDTRGIGTTPPPQTSSRASGALAICRRFRMRGLSSPYRRLIFGLSVSDICQSFAIVAGPWLIRSDVPQSIWGVGNKQTCQLDGFLFLVGSTAVPMYTLCLSIYYVCKLKGRMTDAQFTQRVEKKMHIAIIVINLGLYLIALAMDTINSGVMGNGCFPAAVPTGCRQNPEKYGECDARIGFAAQIFSLISFFVVPLLTLAGVLLCLAVLLWHALLREKIFGRASTRTTSNIATDATQRAGGTSLRSSSGNITSLRSRRNHYLRSLAPSDLSTNIEIDELSFLPTEILDMVVTQESTRDLDNIDHQDLVLHQINTGEETVRERSEDMEEGRKDSRSQSPHDATEDSSSDSKDARGGGNDEVFCPEPYFDSVQAYPSENESACAGMIVPSCGHASPSHQRGVKDNNSNNLHQRLQDLETLSRLYKRELVTQACSYIAIFCSTMLPFLILNLVLVTGNQAPPAMFRASVILYPLAGLFNIVAFARPNVSSFRRKHPDCSILQAFWLVLKAGGEEPNEGDWNDASAWKLCSRRKKPSSAVSSIIPSEGLVLRPKKPENSNSDFEEPRAPPSLHVTEDHINDLDRETISEFHHDLKNTVTYAPQPTSSVMVPWGGAVDVTGAESVGNGDNLCLSCAEKAAGSGSRSIDAIPEEGDSDPAPISQTSYNGTFLQERSTCIETATLQDRENFEK